MNCAERSYKKIGQNIRPPPRGLKSGPAEYEATVRAATVRNDNAACQVRVLQRAQQDSILATKRTAVHHRFPTDTRKRTNDCLIPPVNRLAQSGHCYRGKAPFQYTLTKLTE